MSCQPYHPLLSDAPDLANKSAADNPWDDKASRYIPRNVSEMHRWSELLWYTHPMYRQAIRRVVSYFITDLVLEVDQKADEDKYREFFESTVNYRKQLLLIGIEREAYGFTCSSLVFPFTRYLQCTECTRDTQMSRVEFRFNAADETFSAYCVHCKTTTKHIRVDRARQDRSVYVKRWSPHFLQLAFNPYSGEYRFYIDLNDRIKSDIKAFKPFAMETTPWEVVRTTLRDEKLQLNPENVCFLGYDALSGVDSGGYGISPAMSLVRPAYYGQVLRRYNEALAMDYIVPTRILSPAAGTVAGGTPLGNNMATIAAQLQNIVRSHRNDPCRFHIAPFPVNYQAMGGEGMEMATHELLNQSDESMLNSAGVPMELYRGTLSVQAAPVALRLFQQTWADLVSDMNSWLQWVADRASAVWGWSPAKVHLRQVTLADDFERRSLMLQLMQGQVISAQTALNPFGLNAIDENKKKLEEQSTMAEQAAEMQRDQDKRTAMSDQLQGALAPQTQQQMAATGQQLGTGGMAMSPGAMSPQDLNSYASQLAQQLLQQPEGPRRTQLRAIDSDNPQLHALVIKEMGKMRNQIGTQAVQSMSGAGAPM